MTEFNQLTEDYSRHAVPDSATSSGLEISLILVGALITLPVFLVGAKLGASLGLNQAIAAFLCAGVALSVLGAASGVVAAKARLTTWMIIQHSFGKTGAKIVSFCVAVAILGWYAATVEMFARAIHTMTGDQGDMAMSQKFLYLTLASLLMMAIALFGFKGLDKLSKLAVPLMLLLLIALVYLAMTGFELPAEFTSTMTLQQGISAAIGSFIVGITMFPDICRYARSPKDAVVASGISFGAGVPLVMLFATIPVIFVGEDDFLKVLLIAGLGISGLILLLFATWTTNAYNLYSASLIFASIFERIKKWKLVIAAGIVGTGLAMMPILDNFLHFLHILAVLIPPITGIYLADFFIINKQSFEGSDPDNYAAIRPAAFIAWILGAGIGQLSSSGFITVTTVSAVDAILGGFMIYIALSSLFKKPRAQ